MTDSICETGPTPVVDVRCLVVHASEPVAHHTSEIRMNDCRFASYECEVPEVRWINGEPFGRRVAERMEELGEERREDIEMGGKSVRWVRTFLDHVR